MFHIFRRRQSTVEEERNDAFSEMTRKMPEGNTRIYIEKHLLPEMKYYSKQSRKSKRWYYVLSGLGILIGAAISVLTALLKADFSIKVTLAVLGAASTAVNTLLALLGPKEQWLENRIIKENLGQYLLAYFLDAGKFAPVDKQKNKDQLLYEVCEEEMEKGVIRWQIRNKKTDSGKQKGAGQ